MHPIRMRTARSLTVSRSIWWGVTCMPRMPSLPCTPLAMHAPCHACPPLPHIPPAMHAPLPCISPCHAHPCHACLPLPHTHHHYHTCPPAMHAPPGMHTPCHAHPLPCMPPATHALCHACPPVNRMTDRCKNITLPQLRCGR